MNYNFWCPSDEKHGEFHVHEVTTIDPVWHLVSLPFIIPILTYFLYLCYTIKVRFIDLFQVLDKIKGL